MSKGQFFPYKDVLPTKKKPYVTLTLITANILIFLWSLLSFDRTITTYGFVPAFPSLLTVFTSMFLHGGFDHLLGNMWYLWIFGDNVEDKFGRLRFIFFYLLSGLAATATHYITNSSSTIPAIGASGAVSGVLGAYLVLFPHAKVKYVSRYHVGSMPAYAMIGFWFFLQLIFGTISFVGGVGSGVAFWAHVGGFLFGFLVTKIIFKSKLKLFPF